MKRLLFFAFLATLATGCKTHQGEAEVKGNIPGAPPDPPEWKKRPGITCTRGEPSYFQLVDSPSNDPIEESDLIRSFKGWREPPEQVSKNKVYTRLDLCIDGEDFIELKAVQTGFIDQPVEIHKYDATQDTVEGLKEALFAQDYTKLVVIVHDGRFVDTFAEGLVGTKSNQVVKFRAFHNSDRTSYKLNEKVKGVLEFVDFTPFREESVNFKQCEGGVSEPKFDRSGDEWEASRHKITYGSLSFDIVSYDNPNYNKIHNPADQALADMCKVTITDSSPEANPKVQTFLRNDPSIVWDYEITHHGWRDTFFAKVKGATYGLHTSKEGSGEPSAERKASFPKTGLRITYDNGKVVDFLDAVPGQQESSAGD